MSHPSAGQSSRHAPVLLKHASSATLVCLTSPAFLVSSTNIMCDTMMTCLFVWAVVLWFGGLEKRRRSRLCAAALLCAAAALTKYFAITLVPLLLAYTTARRRRPD